MDENIIIILEKRGTVTATFRKLEPSKKQKIFETAREAFAFNTFENVSLDHVAAGASISKGSLIQYFAKKENLLEFVSEISIDNYRRSWEEYFAREFAVRATDRIRRYFQTQLDTWENDKTGFRFYMKMHYENDFNLTRSFTERILQLRRHYLSGMVTRGMETGEIRRDLEPETIAFILLAAIRDLESAYLAGNLSPKEKLNLSDRAMKISSMLFDGIGG